MIHSHKTFNINEKTLLGNYANKDGRYFFDLLEVLKYISCGGILSMFYILTCGHRLLWHRNNEN